MDFKKDLSFEEFKEASFDAWKAQATKELKKENLDTLKWRSSEGIELKPYYDNSSGTLEGFNNRINKAHEYALAPRWWENRSLVTVKAADAANEIALEALQHGADGIIFLLKDQQDIDMGRLLQGVELEYCSISFLSASPTVISKYLDFVKQKGVLNKIYGDVYWDDTKSLRDFVSMKSATGLPQAFRIITAYSAANDTLDSQLAKLQDVMSAGQRRELSICVNLTEDYFQTIATVKAARILGFQLMKIHNIDLAPEDIWIQGFSMPYKNESYGPHENMLKGTTAAMAGLIGGVNSITVVPENEDNTMMRRVARNVPNMLKEESYFEKVLDPAAGSYFIDKLIEDTCKVFWERFRERTK